MKAAYDIIVVGAGAAGCAAARACALQHPGASVALIEQGSSGPVPHVMRIPMMQPFIRTFRRTRQFVGNINSVADVNLAGRSLTYPCGCGLGGSSLCDDMRYIRGSRRDYEEWRDESWSYDALLPIFRNLESNSRGRSANHGDNGPLRVSDAERSNIDAGMNVRFYEACEAAGVPMTNDFNDGVTDGFSAVQTFTDHGARADIFEALIGKTQRRLPNLTVLCDTYVQRICCTSSTVRTVEVVKRKSSQVLEATNVVVCAGTLRTPLLLQRSGIQPEGAVLDAPQVGQNLITATAADLVFRVGSAAVPPSKSISLRNLAYLYRQWREYAVERTGIFSSFVEGAAYVRCEPQRETPDVSLLFFRTPQMGMAHWPHCWPLDGFTVRVTHHYPTSRGEVRYNAEEGTTQVRSGVLSTKEDVLAMDEGMQWVGLLTSRDSALRSVHHTDEKEQHVGPFWSYNVSLHHPRSGLATQRDTAAFLASNVQSGGDVFGTCALGSVVDSRLRVKGISGLYVADCSVVPTPTIASTRTLGCVIGTRVASFIP